MIKGEQAGSPAAERLVRSGLQPTRRRLQVLAELLREPNDATAQELHERLRRRGEGIGLATVYRTLAAFVEHGIADALAHRRGEACYRGCGDDHHHHLVCTSCHRVVELGDCDLDEWLARAAGDHGFVAVDHRLEVAGVCADCR